MKELIVDVKSNEIVFALMNDKKLIELNREKNDLQFAVGDIYLGRVKKIMSGLNAAFVNVGYERDAFLHYHDLGHQFKSLHKYLLASYTKKNKNISISKLKLEDDIDKNGKISQVIKSGQQVLVQVVKEPISSKGPRLSSEISIPGRNLVLIPFSDKVSISQKIKSEEERKRLKNLIESIKPKNFGVIIRTVAAGKGVAVLDQELRTLKDRFESAFKNIHQVKPPVLIQGEINRTTAIVRDILDTDFQNIYVNDANVFNEIKQYISDIDPTKEKIVKFHDSKTPIFQAFEIEKQIKSSFGKTVSLKNGSYLIIEHTEAFHVIDVNSGNRAKAGNDQETNALEVNLKAAEEIARQVRLRDMGGIIVIDFIDLTQQANKQTLFAKMRELMSDDKAKHNILPLSKFGLMQITRQRVRPETHVSTTEVCPTCMGKGKVTSTVLLTDQIEDKIDCIKNEGVIKSIIIKVHPFVEAYINKGNLFSPSIRKKWQKRYNIKIKVEALMKLNMLDYNFYDFNNMEIKF